MSVSRRIIKVGLSEQEVDRAIREVAEYKRNFLRKVDLLREKIAERIASEAQTGFNGAVVDDLINGGEKLANVDVSIGSSVQHGSMTVVIANGEDAVWVEFGTGVYHNGTSGSSPHPRGAELSFTIGGYGKGLGKRQTWGYYEDGELKLTRGTPAKMPMERAFLSVCNEIPEIVREVFG